MRARVGHLTRKIKIISGANSNNFGFQVLVTTIGSQKGSVTFRGVQFVEGGQPDSVNAALHFLNTDNSSKPSTVSYCSFIRCNGNCLRMVNNSKISIQNNVFAEGRKYIVYASNQLAYTFTNNLMIGARVSRSL